MFRRLVLSEWNPGNGLWVETRVYPRKSALCPCFAGTLGHKFHRAQLRLIDDMSHETHYHRVLLATNEGPLHLSLYPDSHPSKPGHHFLKLVEEDVYDGSQLQAILPKFFVEFVAHKGSF